jgi:hypothetical protein
MSHSHICDTKQKGINGMKSMERERENRNTEASDIDIPPELQEQKKKEFQNLNLSDDFLFGMVMSNPEVCQITLEKILGIQIESIEIPIVEYTIKSSHEQKGVRLDVYIRDVEGNCSTN